jgi:hypothetical protein
MFTYLMALALMTAPPDGPDPTVPAETQAHLRPLVQDLARQWEILDDREVRYILARPEDFAADVSLLQRRFHDLLDAPPLSDGLRFPDRATVNDFIALNRAYRHHLEVRQPIELAHGAELREAVQEVEQLHQVWDMVRDARCEYYYVTVRRQALKRLRELVGEEAYYGGKLPPSVPVWRFQKMN